MTTSISSPVSRTLTVSGLPLEWREYNLPADSSLRHSVMALETLLRTLTVVDSLEDMEIRRATRCDQGTARLEGSLEPLV